MDVLMPQLGETVAEGKITKWFKSAGEQVKPGDDLFEIETDKVSMEVPSTTTGVLAEIRVPAGDVAPVGAIVAVIADGLGAQAGQPMAAPPAKLIAAPVAVPTPAIVEAPRDTRPIKLDPFFEVRTPERNYGPAQLPGGVAVTPLARRLATEWGIDLSTLSGSGPHCRARRRAGYQTGTTVANSVGSSDHDNCPSERRDGCASESALCTRQLRGSATRCHEEHHRGAADAGDPDHPAFLSHRRRGDRPPDQIARRGQ
jgi:pyruvate/2-oxoglutarate dehydrogenase complex dihydrolipoamide acyltransferase (E2) component